MTRLLIAIGLLSSALLAMGCEGNGPPMKPGGGGLPQPYNPVDGQYIPK
jgi:hypothetical protein